MQPLSAGTMLAGRYRLDAPLGAGATATVWRARDIELGRLVAIKVLDDHGVDPELAARFTREGRILARLNHPNIVPVLAAGHEEERPYLVMALVEGVSLKERLAAGPFEIDEAVELVADVAAGLATAHRVGVVHRDIKPANILCGDDGVPRLADFGIARASDLTTMTRADVVMGTAAYLSPEQAKGEIPGPASDVYALGCVLFELLTGRQPFEAPSAVAMAYRHVHDAPVAPSTLRGGIPGAVDSIVQRCLAKRPADRYADAGALEDALRRWRTANDDATVTVAAVPADATAVLPVVETEPVAVAATDVASRRRLPLAVVGATAAALLLIALLTAATGRHGSSSAPPTTALTPSTSASVATTTTTAPPVDVSVTVGKKPHGKHDG